MTAGRIIIEMVNPSLDQDGNAMPKTKLYFYEKGTSTPLGIYADNNLVAPLPNPVIADGAGRFPQIWADVSNTYDVYWRDISDVLLRTFENITPFAGTGVSADGSNVSAIAFRSALGIGSAALEDAGTNGHTVPFLDGANTFSGSQNFTGGATINSKDAGYLGIPPATQNADYTLVLADRGTGVFHSSATGHTWTIPPTVFAQGDAIYLRNIGTGAITVARGSGVALRIAGVTTNADVTLASYGAATLICDGSDAWCISGAGIS